jgi:hypothetical protein
VLSAAYRLAPFPTRTRTVAGDIANRHEEEDFPVRHEFVRDIRDTLRITCGTILGIT